MHAAFERTSVGGGLDTFDYVPLSEARVVAALIQSRSRIDAGYVSADGMEGAMDYGPGVFDLNESIVCTYADLDTLIDTCGMTDGQHTTVAMLMAGYTIADIASICCLAADLVFAAFREAVARIVAQENRCWDATYHVQPAG